MAAPHITPTLTSEMGQSRRFWHVGGMSGLRSISEVPDVQGLPVEDIGSDLIQASRPEPRIVRYELTDFEWAARHHRSAQRTSVDPTPRKRHMPSENGSHRSRMADTLMSQFQRRPENAFYIEPRSGERYPLDRPRWCADGLKPLLLSPQRGITRDEIERGTRSLWRYQASLPVEISKPISLGEGCTPLVQKEWDDFRPFFKLEWFNPTCSFKDRGTTVMLSYLRQLGVDAVLEDSSGNGGASVAAYGAAGGMRVKIIAPAYTSPAKIAQVRAYGAEVQLVEGPREESEREAIRQSDRIFYSSHNWQPFFLQGTKSIAC